MTCPTPQERSLIYAALIASNFVESPDRRTAASDRHSAGAAIDQVTPKLS
jgi:hypothetical protein